MRGYLTITLNVLPPKCARFLLKTQITMTVVVGLRETCVFVTVFIAKEGRALSCCLVCVTYMHMCLCFSSVSLA